MKGVLKMPKKMMDKHKVQAHVLNKELGYPMTKIAEMFSVSQSTISTAIKDVEYKKQLSDIENELNEARNEVKKKGYAVQEAVTLPKAEK